MKILHVVVSLNPALGGPPAVAMRLASAQAQHGHRVTLAAQENPSHRDAINKSMSAVPGISEVQYVPLSHVTRGGWLIEASAAKQLRHLIDEADIVHLHGLWEPLIRTAASLARRLKTPYLIAPHGMLDPWSLRQRWLKKRLALAITFRSLLNSAARLHVLNADESDLLRPLKLRPKAEVIPNGVFIDEIEPLPEPGAFRSRMSQLGDHPFILFLGRLHYKKGLDFLAQSFEVVAWDVPGLHLVVAGPDEGAQAEFEARIHSAGLNERVHVVGPIWGRDKFAAMVDACCFCLPSRQEGFSMAITEAMACRLPVVISENCHFPEVATHAAGEVTPLDVQAIAKALASIVADKQRQRTMGENGRQLVLTRFTWPVIAERTEGIYADVLR